MTQTPAPIPAPNETERLVAARESFSGRLLTDAQFDEAVALTRIVEREILKNGAFKEKLGDYAYAFARTESFDAVKAEGILRDLFKSRTGQSMNAMREELAAREEKLPPATRKLALTYAAAVGEMIETGTKISFNRAFAHQAEKLGGELGITDAGAKRRMKEEFQAAERQELYKWGKEVETRFYKPQIEAEKRSGPEAGPRERSGSSASGAASSGGYRRRFQSGPRP